MPDNIKPGEAYTFAECYVLPVHGEVMGSRTTGASTYLTFIDNVNGVVKRGGMQRRPARPSRQELEQMGFEVVNP